MDKYSFVYIDDINIPELDVYRKYNEIQLRKFHEPEPGLFICESPKVIKRALDAGYEPVSILTSIDKLSPDVESIYKFVNDIKIYKGNDGLLRELAGYALTDGMLACMKRKELPDIWSIINGKRLVAILENITNPTNIGAIFRSAAAMGIEAIIVTYDSTDPYYRRAERVSMGTVFQIPWTRMKKSDDYLAVLKEAGFSTVAMALYEDAISISDPKIKQEDKLAIILGNEGYGLCEDTIRRSEYVAMIPMNPIVDSLNVAAASAVMFWEMSK